MPSFFARFFCGCIPVAKVMPANLEIYEFPAVPGSSQTAGEDWMNVAVVLLHSKHDTNWNTEVYWWMAEDSTNIPDTIRKELCHKNDELHFF